MGPMDAAEEVGPSRVYLVRAAEAPDGPRRKMEKKLGGIARKELKDAPTVPAVSANGAALLENGATSRCALERPKSLRFCSLHVARGRGGRPLPPRFGKGIGTSLKARLLR